MGLPNVVYNWKSLRKLYIGVFIMNVAGCVIVIVMIVSAVKLRMGLGQYSDLVLPGEANFWPGMMFLISLLCAPIYAIGIKLCLHLRFVVPDSVPRLNNAMFIHCMLCLVSMIIVSGIVAVGIHHMTNFHQKSGNGIIETMQEYATEVIAKIRIDSIQIKFRCCGSKSFKDWFHVRWMERDGDIPADNKYHNRSSFLSTDVPFSCCATDILRPCIHHNIMKSSEVYLYQPEHRLTIATTGCHAKVLSHARFIGSMLILALILLAAYQMILTLLSRLLQTAHSNAFYIGPRKTHYLGWVLGNMPSTETYDRLVYGGGEPAVEEMALLQASIGSRGPAIDDDQDREMDRNEEEGMDKVSRKESSEAMRDSNDLNMRSSSSIVTSRHESRNKSMSEMYERASISSPTNTAIPTPPPTPSGAEINRNFKTASVAEKTRRQKPLGIVEGTGVTKVGYPDGPTKLRAKRSTTDGAKKRKCSSKGALSKVNNGGEPKGFQGSLECLSERKSAWEDNSQMLEPGRSPVSSRQLSRVWIRPKKVEEEEDKKENRGSTSSSSSDCKKQNKVWGNDLIEEDEMRIKKFCHDLSTEYKKSPYLKQRKDFSEQRRRPDATPPLSRRSDDGRGIRNYVCARFNPADTYSRFRGTLQDTMMRRGSQTQSGPPPIPIPGDRAVAVAAQHCMIKGQPRQLRRGEAPHFHSNHPFFQSRIPTAQNIERYSWLPRQKPPSRFPLLTSTPPCFPTLRPPRVTQCPRGGGGCHQSYRQISEGNGVRPSPCMQNELAARSRCPEGCSGPSGSAQPPPRFSGCYDNV